MATESFGVQFGQYKLPIITSDSFRVPQSRKRCLPVLQLKIVCWRVKSHKLQTYAFFPSSYP